MLTSERKAQIQLEEAYRLQARAELEKAKSGHPVWSFLNTPFVLWLLSSVVVAGVSFAYAKYEERQKKEAEARVILRRIDAELALRLDHLLGALNDPTLQPMELRAEIVATWIGDRGNFYPEYKSMGLFSLAALAQLHASGQEAAQIRSARLAFGGIWFELKKKVDWREVEHQNAFAAKARPLLAIAALPRWRLDDQDAKLR